MVLTYITQSKLTFAGTLKTTLNPLSNDDSNIQQHPCRDRTFDASFGGNLTGQARIFVENVNLYGDLFTKSALFSDMYNTDTQQKTKYLRLRQLNKYMQIIDPFLKINGINRHFLL